MRVGHPEEGTLLANQSTFYELETLTVVLLLLAFYGGTFLMSTLIGRKKENVDSYMTSSSAVGCPTAR